MYRTLLISLYLSAAVAVTVGPAVTVQNLRLFYGSTEYYVKGMAYSPSPLEKVIENQNYGTGLCTPKRAYTPGSYNNIQTTSPCLLEDYFDGTVYPNGPSGGWWNAVWARDFPLFKQLGINTLRIYHADPITSLEVSSNPNYADKSIIGANHIPFLDLCQSYGFKVVFPLYADESAISGISSTFMMEYIENLIDEVGYHPAVLMYQFGNELQFLNNGQDYVTKINSYLSHARSYQLSRWGRALPVSTALIDYPPYYNTLVPALDMDIITTNAGYRGFNFQNLWSGGSTSFIGLKALSCQTGRPTLIGEMGVHVGQASSTQFNVPSIFPSMMSDIIAHKNSGAIGGFYFEWQEEHWKGVATVNQDWTQAPDVFMGAVTINPGTGQFPVGTCVTKSNGGAYDWSAALSMFSQNVWAVDGPATLGQTSNNYCTGYSTPSTTASSNPVVNPTPSPAICQSMFATLSCRTASEDYTQLDAGSVSGARTWLCNNYPQFCTAINSGGTYSSCNTVEQLSYAMTLYYNQYGPSQGSSACNFGGLGNIVSPVATTSTSSGSSSSGSSSCTQMFSQLKCRTTSEDPSTLNAGSLASSQNWLCTNYPQFCSAINTGGAYASCNTAERLSYAMNQYYSQYGPSQGASACNFGGIALLVSSTGTNNGASTTTKTPATSSSSASTCQTMFAQLKCRTASEDPSQVSASAASSSQNWLCSTYPQFCSAINSGGAYSSCNSVEKLSYAMSQYYSQYGPSQGASACYFGGIGNIITSTATSSATTCQTMFSQLKCRTASEDPSQVSASAVSSSQNWLCANYPQFCTAINSGGAYASCNSVEKLSYGMSQYYAQFGPSQGASACSFGGVGHLTS